MRTVDGGGRPVQRAELDAPVLEVAPWLLGCVLTHDGVAVRLTEVEAYAGTDDPGSHAYRGRTTRTAVMFGPPGHLYVYLSHGLHTCANIVTGPAGTASAVLLRAGEVVDGAALARTRRERARSGPVRDHELARGPGNLGRALGLDREHDGIDVCRRTSPVVLHAPSTRAGGGERGPARRVPTQGLRTGPRVGVSGEGGSGERYPWRFWLPDEPTVSAYRAAASRRDAPRRTPTSASEPGRPRQ